MSSVVTVPSVEVVVIGAGAAGGAFAWRLASAGHEVLCLEQGGWVPPESSPSLSPEWERARQRTHHPNPNVRRHPWDYPIDESDTDIAPLLYNAVGGSTILWGAHFPRLRPSDFRVRSQDGVGDDWPIDYGDLNPYFALNDEMVGVSGLAGDPGNPHRTPRRFGPLPLGDAAGRIARAYDELGWHWWPADAAILSADHGGRLGCNMCGPCDLGCPRGARASSDLTYWPGALASGARLQTEARVRRVLSVRGRVTGVEYVTGDGAIVHQPADTVVLAANGVGTARLLLLSADDWCPDGLANSSGMVGRRLMHHPTAMVTGVFPERVDGFRGPLATTIVSQEYYETDRGRGFVRGFQAQTIRSDGPLGTALGGYGRPVGWGAQHHADFLHRFGHTAGITVTSEDLPDPDNRVTLSGTLRDSAGIPSPELHYKVDANSRKILDFGTARNAEVLRLAGASDVIVAPLVRGAGFHLLGTACMGAEAGSSVVDADCRAWDAPNLLVVDGSVFPTVGAVNPTSTIQAVALRAADRYLGSALPREEVVADA
jgi:choline dehydrogenase-like flavoprotein